MIGKCSEKTVNYWKIENRENVVFIQQDKISSVHNFG